MSAPNIHAPDIFSARLYDKMKQINPGLAGLELDEFRYALANLTPQNGWESVTLASQADIERRIGTRDFYTGVQLKPRVGDRIVLDETIARLTTMLLVGLVIGAYSDEWVRAHFYFDVRGFYFLTRTVYFTDAVLAHFGGRPWKRWEQKQKRFEHWQGIGYRDFKEANVEVDQAFIESIHRLIAIKGTPILITLAGPTAAGKTEIVERLRRSFEPSGRQIASVEMDNFLLDNDYRDERGINSLGKEAYHYGIFRQSLAAILRGEPIAIPRYDSSISSHTPDGRLKPGCTPIEVEPSDVIFLEGNFPFQIKDLDGLIGIKIVYLTDDPIRLKRKWKRDMDYRKKYDLNYFRNRFFRTQFLRAHDCYVPQMQVCDLVVDTTGAAIWATPDIARLF